MGPALSCQASICPPPPHLTHKRKLASPDVVPIQPQGEDGSQRQGAAHSSQIVQVGLGVLDVTRAEAEEETERSRINLFSADASSSVPNFRPWKTDKAAWARGCWWMQGLRGRGPPPAHTLSTPLAPNTFLSQLLWSWNGTHIRGPPPGVSSHRESVSQSANLCSQTQDSHSSDLRPMLTVLGVRGQADKTRKVSDRKLTGHESCRC